MLKYRLPKELTLDYRTWRCGGGSWDNGPEEGIGHGQGQTRLANDRGYSCCLGQFFCQAGVPKEVLLKGVDAQDLTYYDILVDGCIDKTKNDNNKFVDSAILINDNQLTTIAQKVRKLQSLCKKYRRTLVLKNFPKRILKQLDNL
jgi:hypothetical protein